MKNLITYYSRTDTCKNLSNEISEKIDNCEIDQITDNTNYSGFIGWLKAGKNEIRKKTTEIAYKKNANLYDNVLVITPVWAGGMTPAARMYLKKEFNNFNNLYILSVCLGAKSTQVAKSVSEAFEIAQKTFCITKKENNHANVVNEIVSLLSK